MGNKKSVIFLSLLFSLFFVINNTPDAYADCCVSSTGCNAIPSSISEEDCRRAGKTPTPGDCGSIAQCNSSGDKCCVRSDDSKNYGAGNCSTNVSGCTGKVVDQKCTSLQACGGGGTTGGPSTTTFDNPIAFNSVSEFLSAVLANLMGIVAIIAIVFIVIGGIMYMTSGGNEKQITRAKATWTAAVIGLAIALAAPTFLKEIQSLLGGGSPGASADAWVSGALTIKQIAMNVLNLLLSIVGILGIIALVIGGGMYLTAYGDEKKIDSGKEIIKYAIIGIAVALAALIIVKQVASLLGVN